MARVTAISLQTAFFLHDRRRPKKIDQSRQSFVKNACMIRQVLMAKKEEKRYLKRFIQSQLRQIETEVFDVQTSHPVLLIVQCD
jgi:hypothetical protein